MGNMYPQLRDVPDFRHKLWDHLAIMSDFSLDIDSPYPLPTAESIKEKPIKLSYNNKTKIKCRHYGKTVERLLETIKDIQDQEKKKALTLLTANQMKKSFLMWNKDSVEDEQIYNDINNYYGVNLNMLEGATLSNSKTLLQKKPRPVNNNFTNNNGRQQAHNSKKNGNNNAKNYHNFRQQ